MEAETGPMRSRSLVNGWDVNTRTSGRFSIAELSRWPAARVSSSGPPTVGVGSLGS
ncbi:Uncharacterised protein [Mycobacteroides abscessus subsp. abscessus]|nr:Uncharacterised protein [Mycobacteroides abscessus subsp. abscessus]